MLSINLDDVMQVLTNVRSYLIAFGVVLALAIIVMVAVRKLPKAKKKMIRAQSGLAILLALTIVINLICTGPMSTMLDLVSGSGTSTRRPLQRRLSWSMRSPQRALFWQRTRTMFCRWLLAPS